MTGILEALRDPEFRAGILANARSALNGTLHGITTGVLGAPSDLLSMFKYNTLMGGEPTKIPLGSEQLGNYAEQAGILPPRENNISYKAGEFLGPIAAMGVPKAVSAAGDVVGNALGDLAAHQGPAAQFGMVGYHGTPHRFAPTPDNPLGAFDLSKIGTGEGAQAYGHGIYIAENPSIAKDYAAKLAQNAKLQTSDGAVINFGPPQQRTLSYAAQNRGSSQYAIEPWQEHLAMNGGNMRKATAAAKKQLLEAQDSAARLQAIGINDQNTSNLVRHWESVLDGLKTKGAGAKYDPGQYLYHVDLPDEHIANMLDWDRPLSEQAPHIQEAARKLIPGEFASSGAMQDARWGDLASAYDPMQMSGGDFLGRLTSVFGRAVDNPMNASPRASMELNKLGIPGIKYLDAGSRGAGEGTRNFVVFDPSILNILRRE